MVDASWATAPTEALPWTVSSATTSVAYSVYWGLNWATYLAYQALAYVTVTVPAVLYRILSVTFTLTFHFKTLLLLFGALVAVTLVVVRYRVLTDYSRLPKPAPSNDQTRSAFDLHPDSFLDDDSATDDGPETKHGGSASGGGGFPHDFLSVFLSSIQIFGYLEQPVFHELARHLQTRRLLAGDTMFGDNDGHDESFYIVVDGLVQVYLKPEDQRRPLHVPAIARRPSSPVATSCNSSGLPAFNRSRAAQAIPSDSPASPHSIMSLHDSDSSQPILLEALSAATGPASALIDDGSNVASQTQSPTEDRPWYGDGSSASDGYGDPGDDDIDDISSLDGSDQDYYDGDPMAGCQLLTEVKSGEVLSSLFTILSLLTDNVPLRHHKPRKTTNTSKSTSTGATDSGARPSPLSDQPLSASPVTAVFPGMRRASLSRSVDLAESWRSQREGYSSLPPGEMAALNLATRQPGHPDIIARATVDTTLAVLPVEAFHKLTRKFPTASAHIVQVILTRLQRATFMILRGYLGVHRELYELEQAMARISRYRLPTRLPSFLSVNHIQSHIMQQRTSTADLIPGNPFSKHLKHSVHTPLAAQSAMHQAPWPFDQAGEPLASPGLAGPRSGRLPGVPPPGHGSSGRPLGTSRGGKTPVEPTSRMPFSSHSHRNSSNKAYIDPDQPFTLTAEQFIQHDQFDAVRDQVFECMSFGLGLPVAKRLEGVYHTNASPNHPRRRDQRPSYVVSSTARSPNPGRPRSPASSLLAHARSYRSPGVGRSGHRSFRDSGVPALPSGWDAASMRSTPALSTLHEVNNEVELVFVPKGTTLIKQQERAPGIFFVVDGLLYAYQTLVEEQLNSPAASSKTGHWSQQSTAPFGTQTLPFDGGQPLGPLPHPSSRYPYGRPARATPPSPWLSPAATFPPNQRLLFTIKPGSLAGYLGAVSDYLSFVNVGALTDSLVGFLPNKALDRLVDRYPEVVLTLAKRLVSQLSPMVLYIDYALDWGNANPGQIVYREGQLADSILLVLHGRLRAIRVHRSRDHDGADNDASARPNTRCNGGGMAPDGFDILREFGHGESVGELEVLTDGPRQFTLHAIRETEYVKLPKMLFNALALRHPEITLQISRLLAFRTTQLLQTAGHGGSHGLADGPLPVPALPVLPAASHLGPALKGFGRNNVNLKTIGILPVNRHVPVTDFALHLHDALVGIGASAALLNSTTVTTVLGRQAFSRMGKLKLRSWLADQEQRYRLVLYVADGGTNSTWTQQCVRQADCILLVGLGEGDPAIGEYERLLVSLKTTARKELVLLHENRYCATGTTQAWLKHRLWIHAHHHVQMPVASPSSAQLLLSSPNSSNLYVNGVAIRSALSHIKVRFKKYYSRFIPETPPTPRAYSGHRSDFSRLARRLCGQSVGLVLGGGGARGIAHIGIIRAMEEAGIPIDLVGGSSIGAFMGGLYARDSDTWAILGWARMFSSRMASLWRQVLDVTYPVTSYVTGHAFNRNVWKVFRNSQIEDLWLPYFCNTANITFSREEIHQSGYLWRYVRASMSLSGFLPPLCDDNGHMLLDGGYLDNLPVQVMKAMGASIIFAIDVAADDDTSLMDYGDSVSGWWVLLNRWNPFAKTRIPNLAEIQSRLAYVSSVRLLEEAKRTPGCVYVKVPVQQFGVLQFGSFDEILNSGYCHGKQCVEEWRQSGLLDQWDYVRQTPHEKRHRLSRRNSV
ncbi:phosphatidylcholine and lysophosphatidylcholine phospholipase [Dimargaris verticillata]|uniref:Lysophospholipase NTE1 n=1 Tax=Dimargaris verticillata TaxID=2761393 RepID=A0A9W8B2J7_9FUNG|nr:phosphatidylcholine and lysophosphatidylcholine phospholipase [Dimargaris verticillata]